MNASKEQAEEAKRKLEWILEDITCDDCKERVLNENLVTPGMRAKFAEISAFLDAAVRKLPSEASYKTNIISH